MRFAHPKNNIPKFPLSHGITVADYGAGSGAYTISMAHVIGPRGKVYAIDAQQELLQKIKNESLREGLENVEIIWGNIEVLGGTRLLDASVDMALVSNVLFLIKDKDTCVAEIYRILKRNGKAVVIDWKDSFGGIGPWSESIIVPKETESLFNRGGFVLERTIDPGAHHYGIIFKKS